MTDAQLAEATGKQRLEEQREWLDKLPLDSGSILDLGCGAGHHCKYFKDRGMRPTGIDFYADAFQYHGEIQFLNSDFNRLPESFYDAVFASHVLEHCPDQLHTLKAWRRLVRPGGRLYVIVPRYSHLICNDHWVTGWNVGQLACVLASVGFDCSEGLFAETGIHVCGFGVKRDIPQVAMNVPSLLSFIPRPLAATRRVENGNDFLDGHLAYLDSSIRKPMKYDSLQTKQPRYRFDDRKELYFQNHEWKDVSANYQKGLDLTRQDLSLFVLVEGNSCAMRVAFGNTENGTAFASCGELWCTLEPGLNYFAFDTSNLRKLRGSPDYSHIDTAAFGGATSQSHVVVWLNNENGVTLL